MKTTISLKDLLDTTFSINDNGEMVGEFTLKRINMIGDILTQQNEEIERLENIIKEVRKQLDYLETYSSEKDVFNDMKRRLDRIEEILDKGDKE